MKKKGRILVLLMAAMLAAEPIQMVHAETPETVTAVPGSAANGDSKDGTGDNVSEVVSGWIKVQNGYQYRQADGTFLKKSGWVTIEGKKYYLQKGGIRYQGWQTYKKKKRYFLSNGQMAKSRWIKINGQYYYIRKDGTSAPAGKWLTLKGKKYYINKNGYRVTGLQTIKKKKYYFNSKGVLIKNKSGYKIKGKLYEIGSDGVAVKTSALKAECMKKARKFVAKHTNSRMSKSQKLRACFNYILWYNDFKPWIGPTDAQFKTKTWPYQSAIYMFDNGLTGNCYNISSAFAACAKVLGYEPYVIATTGDHGFVTIDGLYYDNMGPLFGAYTHSGYGIRSKVKF